MSKQRKQARRQKKKLRDTRINKLLVDAQYCYQAQELEQANALYQQVLAQCPENVAALHGLGVIALDIGMLDTADELLTAALYSQAGNITLIRSLALVRTRQNRVDEAIELYCSALQQDETNAGVHGELARLYLQSGRMDDALTHFKTAFEFNPSDPRNLHGLMQLDRASITQDTLKTVETLLQQPDLALSERSSFYFALGSIHNDAGRYDDAFANYSVANLAKPMKYDAGQHASFVTRVLDTYTAGLFDEHARAGNDTERPVFIVGMPRSGTTLVEQIIASHPDVHAAGELSHIEHLATSLSTSANPAQAYPQVLETISREDIQHLASTYQALISGLATGNALRVTDKMPLNFIHLGLIALLFPKAHIIHCRRNPLDTCLSCYFQNFSGNHPYASDLKHLGHYYRQYERLMSHWYKVLPVSIHTVDYEELVVDPAQTSQRMLAHIGLPWSEDCVEFYRTRRDVRTASLVQVRQPLYRTSVQRWRHYDKYLHSLKTALRDADDAIGGHDDNLMNTHATVNNEEKTIGYVR